MSAKLMAKVLLILNALGWLANSLLHFARFYDPKFFGLPIQISTILFLAGGIYFYRNPTATKWFGEKLDPFSEASQTITFVASCVCALPPIMFNLYPLVAKYGS